MKARKLMLLGEIGVGKSSLVKRLVFDKFDIDYKPTIGVDVYRYVVPETASREPLTLLVWDTDGNFGQSIFRHVYMKEASAALIVADVLRTDTLVRMAELAAGFREQFPGRYAALILNKMDLLTPGEFPELPPDLDRRGLEQFQTSALTGDNVAQSFQGAADAIIRRRL